VRRRPAPNARHYSQFRHFGETVPVSKPVVTLCQADEAIVRAVAEGDRPERGWADDFPAEGDLAGLQMSRFDADSHEPWSASWLIVVDGLISGTIGFKGAPSSERAAEIGYGVVRSQWGRGIASAALAQLLALLAGRSLDIHAETTVANLASQAVLRKSGFELVGERSDAHDGELLVWRRHVD
jgi:RimJ/RimL family protein N-acetyltransferase